MPLWWMRSKPKIAEPSPGSDVVASAHEWEQLWRLHDELAAAVAERRERAGVELLVNAGILAAAVALTLDRPTPAPGQDQASVGLIEAIGIFLSLLAVLVSYFGLSPGLPWERAPGPELAGWLVGWMIGSSICGPRARRLQSSYDENPLSYRRVREAVRDGESSSVAIRRLARTIDATAIADRIDVLGEQLHQLRLWRRAVTLLTFAAFLAFAARVADSVITSGGISQGDLATSFVFVVVLCLVLAIALRLPRRRTGSAKTPPSRTNVAPPGVTLATTVAITALAALVALQSWAEFGQVLLLMTIAIGFGTYAFTRRRGRTSALALATLAAALTVDVALAIAEFAGWH